jgi:hypothetical protein
MLPQPASLTASGRMYRPRHTDRRRRQAYYEKVVTAKVAEMTPRLVELGLKAKK